MSEFYEINADILYSLKSNYGRKVKLLEKVGYKKLIFHNYDACDIVILSLPNELKVDAGGTNVFMGGYFISNGYTYITKEEFSVFSKKQVQEYSKKTYDFFASLIEYARGLSFVFEHYSWCYDYSKIICDFIHQNPSDIIDINSYLQDIESKLGGGCYYLNAFVAYPVSYRQKSVLVNQTKLLKKLPEIYPIEREKKSLIPSHIRKQFRMYQTDYNRG